MFVESYGQMAVQGTSVLAGRSTTSSTPARASLRPTASPPAAAGSRRPRSAAVAGSRTPRCSRGSGSIAPGRYSTLVASKRLTLTAAFERAGWRTVADVPATHGTWPEGHSFYHYDKIWDRDNLGYRGPKFAFSPMPDQWALQALQKREFAKRHRRPVFSEIDLTSSHEPWTRIPPLISWNRLGDGSIFNRRAHRPNRADRHPAGLRDLDPVRAALPVLVRRALRQQEHRPHRAGRPPALAGDLARQSRGADHDHRARPEGDSAGCPAGAGRTGCCPARRPRSGS